MIWECEPGRLPSLIAQVEQGDFIAMDGNMHLVILSRQERGLLTVYLAPDPEVEPEPKTVVKMQVGQNDFFSVTPVDIEEGPDWQMS